MKSLEYYAIKNKMTRDKKLQKGDSDYKKLKWRQIRRQMAIKWVISEKIIIRHDKYVIFVVFAVNILIFPKFYHVKMQ